VTRPYQNWIYDIWAIQPDGQGLRNLTQHPAHDTCPAWSPDGRQLAFISTRHGGSDIYIMSLEGLLPPPSDKTR
jgi:TolB protein